MKIDPTGVIRSGPIRRNAKSPSSRQGEFAKELSAAPQGTPVAGTAGVQGVDALFALQQVDDALTGSGQAQARGHALLDQLDRLRLALLDGMLSEDVLWDLKKLVESRRARVDDARLAEVLDEIELRAEVELAKFSRVA